MEIIYSGRGTGKTTELIKIAHEQNKYIVCRDHRETERIVEQAKKLNCKIKYPLTFDEFINHRYSGNINSLLIDGAEMLIQNIAKVPIEVITINKD